MQGIVVRKKGKKCFIDGDKKKTDLKGNYNQCVSPEKKSQN